MEYGVERRVKHRIAELSRRKTDLEVLIDQELKGRMPCSFTLRRLKTLKLSVKDRIAELKRLVGTTAKARLRSRVATGLVGSPTG